MSSISTRALPIAELLPRLPPGTMMWSGGCQSSCSSSSKRESFLTFDAKWVDGIQLIDRGASHKFQEQTKASVEVSAKLAGKRSVVERLG